MRFWLLLSLFVGGVGYAPIASAQSTVEVAHPGLWYKGGTRVASFGISFVAKRDATIELVDDGRARGPVATDEDRITTPNERVLDGGGRERQERLALCADRQGGHRCGEFRQGRDVDVDVRTEQKGRNRGVPQFFGG